MKAIRLVNGHFDGESEAGSGEPRQQIHKRLPHGEWVDRTTGQPVTHDVYHLTTDQSAQRVYLCSHGAIEKATWLKSQALKQAR